MLFLLTLVKVITLVVLRYIKSVDTYVINSELLTKSFITFRIYVIIDINQYLLLKSTLLNNEAATYLIKLITLLELENFVKLINNSNIKAGTLSLIIKGRGTYVLKDVFY